MPLTAEDRELGFLNSRDKLIQERDERWADIERLLERTQSIRFIEKTIGVSANTLSRQARRASYSAETKEERERWRRHAARFDRYAQSLRPTNNRKKKVK